MDSHDVQRQLDITLTEPPLCAAIIGRLTFAGNIIETALSLNRPGVSGELRG